MALKGTLKDFSVADIFQLIGQQTKSGSLYVRNPEEEVHIVFDEGRVVLGTFRKSVEDFLLGTMLLRAEVITAEQLAEAVESQKVSMRSLGDILRSMGAISADIVGEFIGLQLKEVLFRLFQWKDGFYEFVTEQIRYNKSIIKPQSAEGVLMDGFRMLDEWPRVTTKTGNVDSVFRSLADPGTIVGETEGGKDSTDNVIDNALAEFEKLEAAQKNQKAAPTFSTEEKKVLRHLDGNKSLQQIIYLSRLGTFDTCRIVADLIDRGQVIKVDHQGQTRMEPEISARNPHGFSAWLLQSYRLFIFLFILAAAFPLLMFSPKSYWSNRYGAHSPGLENTSLTLQAIQRKNQQGCLENALEVYRLEQDSYPRSLEELGHRSPEKKWKYQSRHSSYVLYPR